MSQKFDGDKARVAVLRNGRRLSLSVALRRHHRLVPVHIQGHAPSYLIVAGIVFTPLTVPYLRSEVRQPAREGQGRADENEGEEEAGGGVGAAVSASPEHRLFHWQCHHPL